MHADQWGLAMTAANGAAVDAYGRTLGAYLAFSPDTGTKLKEIFAADARMPMAHVLRGYFMHLMGMPALVPKAAEALATASEFEPSVTARERLHIEALRFWCRGELERAVAALETILTEHPRDVLALRLVAYLYFYLGDSANIRDCVARVLPEWSESTPGYAYLLGMHAFGLEESGDYAAAERCGRKAVELNPADAWAVHAVAHVLEMQDRRQEGVEWIRGLEPHWSTCNNFRYHLWWHRALMHLELREYDEVLALYDQSIFDPKSEEYLDLCNDIALLMRLEMAGVAVGARWSQLADKVKRQRAGQVLAFVDAHYVLATAAAEGLAAARGMIDELRTYAALADGTTARVTRDVGIALAESVVAYRQGDYAGCVEWLLPVRHAIIRLGGSHAQRDMFAQLLIDAAMRAGKVGLVKRLLAERIALRPQNAWARTRLDSLKHRG